jgi:hypothetical protein
MTASAEPEGAGWTDGLPEAPATPERVAEFLAQTPLAPEAEIGPGVTVLRATTFATRAGCRPECLPVVIAALEAVLDPAFRPEHLGNTFSPWPAFVVNGPVAARIGLYNGIYVMAAGRRANVTIGRAISLTLANCLPEVGGVRSGVLGNASRMAGLVIGEKEDTPWESLSALLGYPREASTVTVFSTFNGSPLQILPLGARFSRAEGVAALFADQCAEGWGGPGTRLVVLSPNALRVFLADGWSRADLRRYLVEHTRVPVAYLKRTRRWTPGADERPDDEGSAPIAPEDEARYLSLAGGEVAPVVWRLPDEDAPPAPVDFLPVVAGSEVAHLYTHWYQPYPTAPHPVTKVVRTTGKD